MQRDELTDYLDDYLDIAEIEDYGPQGLQVEGRVEIQRIVGLVDAALPCIDAALERDADLMLVHHGIFWGGPQCLRGPLGAQVHRIVRADLNLYAAHLPLDAHREVGNNAVLAERLGLNVVDWFGDAKGTAICALAEAGPAMSLDVLVSELEQWVGDAQRVQAHGPRRVRRVGVCSGGGAPYIAEAAAQGCDTFLTGETSHSHHYDASRYGLNVIYGGHYATETVGVQALGEHLALRFGLDFEFVDLPTGV